MQRQSSILSFFQKPSPVNPNSAAADRPTTTTNNTKISPENGNCSAGNRPTTTSNTNKSTEYGYSGVRNLFNYNTNSNASKRNYSTNIPSENVNSGVGNRFNGNSISKAGSGSLDAFGTDSPPEKIPNRVNFSKLTPDDDVRKPSTSVFDSIRHKFAKVDANANANPSQRDNGLACSMYDRFNECKESPKKCSEEFETVGDIPSMKTNGTHYEKFPVDVRSGGNGACSMYDRFNECKETPKKCGTSFGSRGYIPLMKTNGTEHEKFMVDVKSGGNGNVLQSETPPSRPFVPRLKRIQEDCPNVEETSKFNLTTSSKRAKILQESNLGDNNKEVVESVSKFEWLHPSKIKDAKGRRPDDPLFDKRTLYIPPDTMKKMTASQKQYWSVKCQYMDVLLFFKVGKFYELYEVDAEIGHKELDWKMTISGVGRCRQVGISESGIDDAVQKLVARGYKVGRIEQLETSDQAKARGSTAVIPRKLVTVVTPSTSADDIGPDAVHLLALTEGSCGIDRSSTIFGFAFVDCAALKIWIGSVSDDVSCAALMALLMQVSPKEIIYDSQGLSREAQKVLKKYSSTGTTEVQLTPALPVHAGFDAAEVQSLIQSKKYFKGANNVLDSLHEDAKHGSSLCALGGLITHLSRLMLDDVLCNGDILPYQVYKGCLRMDGQTLVNLEVFHNNVNGGTEGTLFKYLNRCLTHSGKRLLRNWICHPPKDVKAINNRLDIVEALMTRTEIMLLMAQYLRKLPDLERLLGRVKASVHSQATLLLPLVGKKTLKQRVKVFGSLVKGLRIGLDLLILLQNEGQIMSLLLGILNLPEINGHDGLVEFLTQFEAAIDSDFPNYQNHEATESDAETLSILVELFVEKVSQWSQITYALSSIDVLRSFAAIAIDSSGPMSRPSILPQSTSSTVSPNDKGPVLSIKGLWHPFALGEHGIPVPNDLVLGEDANEHHPRTLLLTGPNMGGKSTLLRAVCLAVVIAQLGCYVPCETCTLSVADIIFTRLGATDRIMTGESTFYIECAETASVLKRATQDSLVLLDELGRGTSTFDGYAIAYAVFRHLIEKVNCRLLFATHYHSLTKEFASHPHVSLQHMACALNPISSLGNDVELVFLYKLASGACPESYGLQVALMAGIPKQVVDAASTAGQTLKEMVGKNFNTSENRSKFSTLHENWLKTVTSISSWDASNFDDDAYDTLFCLWHEVRSSYLQSLESV